jgi:hypothetical protein
MKSSTKHNSAADILSRLGTLIGVALAIIGVAVAMSGYLPALLLVPVGILLAGWRRIAQYIN